MEETPEVETFVAEETKVMVEAAPKRKIAVMAEKVTADQAIELQTPRQP